MPDDITSLNLQSVAKFERKKGNVELAGILETVARDQQAIMGINNSLRDLGNELAAAARDIHPIAPSNSSMKRLHLAADAWSHAVLSN